MPISSPLAPPPRSGTPLAPPLTGVELSDYSKAVVQGTRSKRTSYRLHDSDEDADTESTKALVASPVSYTTRSPVQEEEDPVTPRPSTPEDETSEYIKPTASPGGYESQPHRVSQDTEELDVQATLTALAACGRTDPTEYDTDGSPPYSLWVVNQEELAAKAGTESSHHKDAEEYVQDELERQATTSSLSHRSP